MQKIQLFQSHFELFFIQKSHFHFMIVFTTSSNIFVFINHYFQAKLKAPRQSNRKQTRGAESNSPLTISQILAQLDALRLYGEAGQFGFFKGDLGTKTKFFRKCFSFYF